MINRLPFDLRKGAAFAAAVAALVSSAAHAQAPAASPPVPPPGAAAMPAATEFGFGIFQRNCTSCHGNPAVERAPTPTQLRQFPAERIYAALTTGAMKTVGDTLTDQQRRQVSESLAGRPLGAGATGDAGKMPNRCSSNPPMNDPASQPGWNGWGAGLANTRFQPADQAKLPMDSVGKLKLKWVFGLPNATSAYGQPTVVSGRLFVGADTGYIYSLDAQTGCVYWSYQSKAGVRNAMTIGEISGHKGVRYAVYYGDLKANAYALDAQTGHLLWTSKIEEQYTNRVTAAPAFYHGRLYVPISSWEEFAASTPTYPCCTSVGSVSALDANTGKQIWKTYVIEERPKPVRLNSAGVQQWAPAGGSVWNTPTIDPKRNTVYFGTGDATTYPAALTSDAVMALNMDTGKVLWTYQVTKNDSFLGGCGEADASDNCPKRQGPDWDIPAPVMLRTVNGRDMVLVSTKPGDILALDPDSEGAVLWKSNVRGVLGGRRPREALEGRLRASLRGIVGRSGIARHSLFWIDGLGRSRGNAHRGWQIGMAHQSRIDA